MRARLGEGACAEGGGGVTRGNEVVGDMPNAGGDDESSSAEERRRNSGG